ncbi:MAG: tetratricopeptide repeat protein [Acidobacteriota bacterium]
MRCATAALVMSAVLSATALAAPPGPPADRVLYEDGRQAVLEMRWAEASTTFERLLRKYPDSSFGDAALYWQAFTLIESGDCASAYAQLEILEKRYPSSPRARAGRALRVRCAGKLLIEGSGGERAADYAHLIAEASHTGEMPARMSAAEVLLSTRPVEGVRTLQELARDLDDPSLLEVILDRHFGGASAVSRPLDPALPLGPTNAVILVRYRNRIQALGLAEALRAAKGETDSDYPASLRSAIHDALLEVRRSALRRRPTAEAERSQVAQVDDTELHLYHRGDETVRILVLNRERGYREENIRVFFERNGELTELPVSEAEKMARVGDTSLMGSSALTFVGSSLALIRVDLEAAAALGGGR